MTSTSEKQEFGETGYPQNGGSSSAPPPPSYADPYPQTNYAYPPLAYPPPQPTSHAAPTSYAYPPQPTTLVVPPTSTATATPAPAPDYSAAIRRRKAWTYAILGAIFAATGAILLSFWNRSWYCYGTSCYYRYPSYIYSAGIFIVLGAIWLLIALYMCVSRPKPAVQVQQEVYPAAVVVVQQQPVQEQLPRYEPGAGGSYPSGSGGGYPTPTQQQQGGYGMNPDPYK